jgi:uncharacterized protein
MRNVLFISILTCMLALLFGCASKNVDSYIFDMEGDLNKTEIQQLDSLFTSHQRKTSNEIVLVTTSQYGSDTSIKQFAVNFGKRNGIGSKEKNNGVVIAFSAINQQLFIATGTGTEKILKDEIVKQIIDSLMIPEFKQAKTFRGLWLGSKAVIDFLEKTGNEIK